MCIAMISRYRYKYLVPSETSRVTLVDFGRSAREEIQKGPFTPTAQEIESVVRSGPPLARIPVPSRSEERGLQLAAGRSALQSGRGPGRPLSRAGVGGAVFVDSDIEERGQRGGIGVGKSDVSTFDPAQAAGGNLRGRSELRLCNASDYAPVAGVALGRVYFHDLADRRFEDLHNPSQQVDLRSIGSGLPGMDCGRAGIGEARQVRHAQAAGAARVSEFTRAESAQDPPSHTRLVAAVIGRQIHRHLRLAVNYASIDCCFILEYRASETAVSYEKESAMRVYRRPGHANSRPQRAVAASQFGPTSLKPMSAWPARSMAG